MRIQSKSYRPELHYMRGPGPKWQEKNGAPASPHADSRLDLPYSSWAIASAAIILVAAATALALA